jgi:hypothetical protein
MNRPSPGDLSAALKPELRDAHVAELARLDNALARENDADARAALEELQPAVGKTRAWQELDMALAPTRTGGRRPGGGSLRSAPGRRSTSSSP